MHIHVYANELSHIHMSMYKSYLSHNNTSHKYMGKPYKFIWVHIKISFSNKSNIYIFFIVIHLEVYFIYSGYPQVTKVN